MSEEDNVVPVKEEEQNAFSEALKKATDAKLSIENDSKARYGELSKEFADFMLDRVSDEFKNTVAPFLGLYEKIPTDAKPNKVEKKKNAALRSFFKQMFNKSTDLILHKDDAWPKESSTSKVYPMMKNLVATMWIAKEVPEIKRMLEHAGIEIVFHKDIDTISDGSEENEGDVKARNQIVEEGVSALRDTVEKNMHIEDEIYPTIPDNLKYDPDSNPKGIKRSQFTSLASVTAKKSLLESAGEVDKAKDLVSKTSEGFFYGSINQKLLFDTYGLLN